MPILHAQLLACTSSRHDYGYVIINTIISIANILLPLAKDSTLILKVKDIIDHMQTLISKVSTELKKSPTKQWRS